MKVSLMSEFINIEFIKEDLRTTNLVKRIDSITQRLDSTTQWLNSTIQMLNFTLQSFGLNVGWDGTMF